MQTRNTFIVIATIVLCFLSFSGSPACADQEYSTKGRGAIPGTGFRDCQNCPEMVILPPGTFMMGSADRSRYSPVHSVIIGYSLAVGKFEVTFDEWDACVADGGCAMYRPLDAGWGRGKRPVVNVSWNDAQNYVQWLARKTGKSYRLLTESEWEYAGRAGATTRFPWGDDPGVNLANCHRCGSQWDTKQTAPVGSFPPNRFGVYDMVGNVTEWVQDPWNPNYNGAPTNGGEWSTGDSRLRVFRKGSWYNSVDYDLTFRNAERPDFRSPKVGFRIARTL